MMLNEVTESKFKNAFNGILCKLNIEKVCGQVNWEYL